MFYSVLFLKLLSLLSRFDILLPSWGINRGKSSKIGKELQKPRCTSPPHTNFLQLPPPSGVSCDYRICNTSCFFFFGNELLHRNVLNSTHGIFLYVLISFRTVAFPKLLFPFYFRAQPPFCGSHHSSKCDQSINTCN